MIVAIDGPSGAGKSTLARRVAREFGFMYLDTGALYRALGLKVLRQGAEVADDARMAQLVESTDIDLKEQDGRLEVFLDGEEVSALIRTPEVSQMASKVSALKAVRQGLLEIQRALGRRGSVVAEGRDIGTVVFPEAEVKIFLDASVKERARRRSEELRAAGRPVGLEETQREMEERDRRDSERELAPLRKADDAMAIDSSSLGAEAVAQRVIKEIRSRTLET
ncbi:MAG: (d)CMP kinase [Deltaproteobacteria bacterium]|nr:(d)CMP kinase [Deltaproteobacteria bacterium]